MAKEKKKVECLGCGYGTMKTYDFDKQKWTRKFKCPKCGNKSFKWYNF